MKTENFENSIMIRLSIQNKIISINYSFPEHKTLMNGKLVEMYVYAKAHNWWFN